MRCRLGSGRMSCCANWAAAGWVWSTSARQENLNRFVALKMILAGAHAGASGCARLRSEAKVLARLRHPNIVQIHDIGEHAGQPFLVMEYLVGGDLEEYLRGQPLPPRGAAELLAPFAEAIDAAHRAGIIHRDLKPGNILLALEGPVSADDASSAAAVPRAMPTPAACLAHSQDHRLRAGQAAGGAGRGADDEERYGGRHAQLHGPGTSRRPACDRSGGRPLGAGGRALHLFDRPASVPGRQPGPDFDASAPGRAGVPDTPATRRPAQPGDHLP